MSIVITFDVSAKQGHGEQLVGLFQDSLTDTRNFEGCIKVDLHIEKDSAVSVFMIEEWATQQAYEKYLSWRGNRGDMQKLMELIDGDPVKRFFDQI